MPLEHACFISFSRGSGKDSQFAELFFDEFSEHMAALDKTLSIFKFDRCEKRRKGDAWDLWIQRELCDSAMMIAICAPNYFNGSPGCVSEFEGMETLITQRNDILGNAQCESWLIGLRLKDKYPMPKLNGYSVCDFLDCFASPEKVRRMHKYRKLVENLADTVYKHWLWLHNNGLQAKLNAANMCESFTLPKSSLADSDPFPHVGGVI